MNRRLFLSSGVAAIVAAALVKSPLASANAQQNGATDAAVANATVRRTVKTDAEWKRILTAPQYQVTRQKATEAPYSSPLNNVHRKGVFVCVCCAVPLFSSETKFDSGTGWPSFWSPIAKENVREEVDSSMAETRTEVLCAGCDSHLGHVFGDGPQPTGLRYCMNGVALKFNGQRRRRA